MIKLVAIALADHAHDDGTEARPSQALLEAKTGLSNASVRRSLRHLLEIGVIRLERRSTQHHANVYAFDLRVITQTTLTTSQGDHTVRQGGHTVRPEGSHRSPNHKNRPIEPTTVNRHVVISPPDDLESEAQRRREIEAYGHVLSDRERIRLIKAQLKGMTFVPDGDVS